MRTTPGGIAYIGLSYLRQALAAASATRSCRTAGATSSARRSANITDEVAAFKTIPANGAISLEYSKAKAATFGYPDVNFEYAIVKPSQSNGNTAAGDQGPPRLGMDPTGGATPSS